jgi:hypothetical protein
MEATMNNPIHPNSNDLLKEAKRLAPKQEKK